MFLPHSEKFKLKNSAIVLPFLDQLDANAVGYAKCHNDRV